MLDVKEKINGNYRYVLRHHRFDYFFDSRRHKLPHIHVKYQGEEAVLSIPEGEVLEGKINNKKLRLVQAWIEIHHEELMADWELASEGETVFKIDPLK